MTMAYIPGPDEWDTSVLPDERKAYLNAGHQFEEIVAALLAEAAIVDADVDPCEARPPVAPANARRACFRLRVSPKTYDLFYNAPDGLRGRYWQGPDIGYLATRHVIDALTDRLMTHFRSHPPSTGTPQQSMSVAESRASLAAVSAKVWVRERDDAGNTMISLCAAPQLSVQRWKENEVATNNRNWRWTPIGDELEIKGAFLSPEGHEYIPESKRDRSCQIHRYGFT